MTADRVGALDDAGHRAAPQSDRQGVVAIALGLPSGRSSRPAGSSESPQPVRKSPRAWVSSSWSRSRTLAYASRSSSRCSCADLSRPSNRSVIASQLASRSITSRKAAPPGSGRACIPAPPARAERRGRGPGVAVGLWDVPDNRGWRCSGPRRGRHEGDRPIGLPRGRGLHGREPVELGPELLDLSMIPPDPVLMLRPESRQLRSKSLVLASNPREVPLERGHPLGRLGCIPLQPSNARPARARRGTTRRRTCRRRRGRWPRPARAARPGNVDTPSVRFAAS